MRRRAAGLGAAIRAEDGVARVVAVIEREAGQGKIRNYPEAARY
jgi:hypothetical protein